MGGRGANSNHSSSNGGGGSSGGGSDSGPTTNEINSLREYAAAGRTDINPALRSGKPLNKEDKQTVKDIEHLMKNGKTTKEITVYRGYGGHTDKLANAKVGDVMPKDKAFMSTSTSKDIGAAFANKASNDEYGKRWVAKITVPKGTPSVDVKKSIGKYSMFAKAEKEVLLPRNTKLKVTGISKRGNYNTVNMEVVH